ncbi:MULTISPECIES: xanthine dehydrogenase family protein molybdopterin-binding subunit [unclassified Nocardioides]|uniref:xanthine dehydrogenase family protein molybdopterin-binding subunit n=1 Tax=unclassified Nocardioides TaxID=2615069 RepID=UPI0009F08D5B|nr:MULTISPECIES: xanthine dehydrogenase family protein molybdopterin-binding subunit [unclassified Nocardioides]GAW49149.1 Aldehyde oxidase and xanthine dehydrogenase molybdopterin binding protein [Nocardioides sp. PD653-B2]GAW55637.1 Aldehyde oxidase and xanthine dehydrogenase moly bdopterin binding protein [Nocardioides sp. PD653]
MSQRRDSVSSAARVGAPTPVDVLGKVLRGHSFFVGDIEPVGTLHMAVLRSPHAHALIREVRTGAARVAPGVHAVVTGAEVAAVTAPHPVYWQLRGQHTPVTRAMAVDRVRYCGQAVAAVVAETRALAEDALELIGVDYEPLQVVNTAADALRSDAPLLVPEWGENVFGEQTYSTGDVDEAFAGAPIVVEETFRFGRSFGCPLETRGCLVSYDEVQERFDVWINSQSPNRVREVIGEVVGVPLAQIRVRIPSVGGGFGTKANYYGEEIIATVLARMTRRPVKYIEDRDESFVASSHAREQELTVAIAADADGRVLGLRGDVVGVLGGELSSVGMGPVWLAAVSLPGPYKIANVDVRVRGVMTNRSPYGSYRGWGAPKAVFAIERMLDRLGRRVGVDAAEIRRRNLVRADEMPYHNGVVATFDSGDYHRCLQLCLDAVTTAGWPSRIVQAATSGRRLGVGLACYVESTGIGPSRVMERLGVDQAGFDEAVVRMDSDGEVTVYTGQAEMGQGILTSLAQTAAHELGLPSSRIKVVSGDTDVCTYTGYGTAGSRGAALGCESVRQASVELRGEILRHAAAVLETDPTELRLDEEGVHVHGVPTQRVSFAQIGRAAYRGLGKTPDGFSGSLQARVVYDPSGMTYSYGTAAVLVEVDSATGFVRVLDARIADDCGTVINPDVVEGQLVGASVQALAGALFEELRYDDNGRLVTKDLMTYRLPRADDFGDIEVGHLETPTPHSDSGVKGVGEAGTLPWAPAICAAVEDALGVEFFLTQVPVSPETVAAAARGEVRVS